MKVARLFHNEGAGDGKYGKKELTDLIEANGYSCIFTEPDDEDWDKGPIFDFIIIAGGDGTVRKVVKMILEKGLTTKYPIALLPMGTANNISRTLGITGTAEQIIATWRNGKILQFDIGNISGLDERAFFLEGFGFGIFPNLINEMKAQEEKEDAQERLQQALSLLLKTIDTYTAKACTLEIEGTDHSGKFLLVEIMNTMSLGPNLFLNPSADPGDGELEVVLITESQREKFSKYVRDKITGIENNLCFSTLKAKNIKIEWQGIHVHVDDKIVRTGEHTKATVTVEAQALKFLAAKNKGDALHTTLFITIPN